MIGLISVPDKAVGLTNQLGEYIRIAEECLYETTGALFPPNQLEKGDCLEELAGFVGRCVLAIDYWGNLVEAPLKQRVESLIINWSTFVSDFPEFQEMLFTKVKDYVLERFQRELRLGLFLSDTDALDEMLMWRDVYELLTIGLQGLNPSSSEELVNALHEMDRELKSDLDSNKFCVSLIRASWQKQYLPDRFWWRHFDWERRVEKSGRRPVFW